MRSHILKKNIETLPHRALLMSSGLKQEDFGPDKPFIGVANSYNDRLKDTKIPERKLTPLLESYREKFAGINCYGK